MNYPLRRTRGISLVELLVVIAIIGILVALLLPGVQSAREAARRTQCTNDVKQLGVALHNHEATYKRFPPAGRGYAWCQHSASSPGDTEIYNANGLMQLLPFLEMQSLYDKFNHKEAYADAPSAHVGRNTNGTRVGDPNSNGNAQLCGTIVSVFICPSDRTAFPTDRLIGASYGPGNGLRGAATNYDFITSDLDFSFCNNWSRTTVGRRMFGENSTTRSGDVVDGLSNTFAIGETTRWHVNGNSFAWAYRAWVMTGVDPHTTDPGINLWHLPHVHPTWQNPPFQPLVGRVRTWWAAAASLHPGGSNFMMGDGSVQFVSQTTDKVVLAALSTMAGSEAVSFQ